LAEKETDQKQKGSEVKTFPVPFAFTEKQENISISTNTPTRPSKEQIINQAFKFHSQGNISEAAKYYQYFINQGFKDHRVFSNYGVILKDLGKLEDAELSYCKAIELKPDYGEAYFNLFRMYEEINNLEKLNDIKDNDTVNLDSLVKKGLIFKPKFPLKILGNGTINVKLKVQAHAFTKIAKQKIEDAGGSCELINNK